jgi:antitoxin (DNA-binding transcriptional repressor) of toxin-antitoxin stability system
MLLRRVQAGEEVIIARAGRPVARLVPYESRTADRVGGRYAGAIRISPDFDAPLPPDILSAFEDVDEGPD